MRMLLTLATIVAAMLVPWNELAPSWLPDASGSATEPTSDANKARPGESGARLNPAWGIVPVLADEAEGLPAFGDVPNREAGSARQTLADLVGRTRAGGVHGDDSGDLPPGVHCENGVCTLPDGSYVAEPATRRGRTSVDQARARLLQLGATQFRLDRDAAGDEYRCSCALPLSAGSRLQRRFEAKAESEEVAVRLLLGQVDEWRRERNE